MTAPTSPAGVVAAWFSDVLTWDSFQHLSDEDMAQSMLDALAEAGYLVMTHEELADHVAAPLNRLQAFADRLMPEVQP